MPDFNTFYESFFSDHHQEEEPMDWKNVPFLPEVSVPFVPSRLPRKMRSSSQLRLYYRRKGVFRYTPEAVLRDCLRGQPRGTKAADLQVVLVPRATLFF
ncbi:hypothetical protein TNCV_4122991 [Trichonephila clavipes]|nr:hypothetical protein TNCV_4122991 [Trichonephila clavipes]